MLELAKHFSNGMVVQYGKPFKIHGNADGKPFELTLPPRNAGERFDIHETVNGEPLELLDLVAGDVWLCGGQSNMELPMERVKYFYPEEFLYSDDLIRQFDTDEDWGWISVNPATINKFSSLAYFFAKQLRKSGVPIGLYIAAVGGSPIHTWMANEPTPREWQNYDTDFPPESLTPGVYEFVKTVNIPPQLSGKSGMLFLGTLTDSDITYINGEKIGETGYRYPPRNYSVPPLSDGKCEITVKLSVMSPDGGFTYGKQRSLWLGNSSIDLNGIWQYRRTYEPLYPDTYDKSPTALYKRFIEPLTDLQMRGIIWYQGESDEATPDGYAKRFKQLITGWRTAFKQELPFLFTELARYTSGGSSWRSVRKQQREALTLPLTGMAAAYDLGEDNDLHPQNKRDIAARLALLANAVTYGETINPSPFILLGGL